MNQKIKDICVSILRAYQGIEEHDAWEYVNKVPPFSLRIMSVIVRERGN